MPVSITYKDGFLRWHLNCNYHLSASQSSEQLQRNQKPVLYLGGQCVEAGSEKVTRNPPTCRLISPVVDRAVWSHCANGKPLLHQESQDTPAYHMKLEFLSHLSKGQTISEDPLDSKTWQSGAHETGDTSPKAVQTQSPIHSVCVMKVAWVLKSSPIAFHSFLPL